MRSSTLRLIYPTPCHRSSETFTSRTKPTVGQVFGRSALPLANTSVYTHFASPRAGVDRERLKDTEEPKIRHGVPEHWKEFSCIHKLGGHTFRLPPLIRARSEVARNDICSLYDPSGEEMAIEQVDRARERLAGAEKREKSRRMASLYAVFLEELSLEFQNLQWKVDYEVIEKMFYPRYLPTHAEVCRAFGLKRKWIYTPEPFCTLENISRFVLSRVTSRHRRTLKLNFQEWYSLFLNYHHSFHPLRFLCEVGATTIIYTREFIDAFAEYLRHQCQHMGITTRPIVDIYTLNGRLAYHLNQTGRIPVPVIPCHENPRVENFLLRIPQELQAMFDLPQVHPLNIEDALKTYRPAIVICQDMSAEKDFTRQFRMEGSVKEYILLGIPFSYVSGHMWYTWGHLLHRPRDDKSVRPHHHQEGFCMRSLSHLSRWIFERNDSPITTGFAQVVSFCRLEYAPSLRQRMHWFFSRLQTFY